MLQHGLPKLFLKRYLGSPGKAVPFLSVDQLLGRSDDSFPGDLWRSHLPPKQLGPDGSVQEMNSDVELREHHIGAVRKIVAKGVCCPLLLSMKEKR